MKLLKKSVAIFLKVSLIVVIILLVPQTNLESYPHPTLTSKFIVFSYLCIIAFPFSLFYLFKIRKYEIKFSIIDFILLILILYIIINRYYIQSDIGFSIPFFELIYLCYMYIVIRNVPNIYFLYFFIAIIIAGIIQSTYGYLQLLGYLPSNHSRFNLTGSFFNPGPYAGFLVSVIPISISFYIFRNRLYKVRIQKQYSSYSFYKMGSIICEYIPLISVILIIPLISATQSRGAWLSVFVSSILLLELRYQTIKTLLNKLNNLQKYILTVTAFLAGISCMYRVYKLKEGSSNGRLLIWKISSNIIKDNPFFGVGFDRFQACYMNYQANYFKLYETSKDAVLADNTLYAFNEFIQFTVEQGLLGVLIIGFLLVFIFRLKVEKTDTILRQVLLVCLLGMSVFAFFSYPMQILPIKLILVTILGVLATIDSNKILYLPQFKNKLLPISIKTVISIAVLVISIFSFIHIKKAGESLRVWKMALDSYNYGDYSTSIEEYKQAYPFLKNQGEFLMNYGKALELKKQSEEAIQVLNRAKKYLNNTVIETTLGDAYKKTKKYKQAEMAYMNAANMIPSRFYPLYLLVKLYLDTGEDEKALAMAKTILSKEVKVPSTAIKQIQSEMHLITQKCKLYNE